MEQVNHCISKKLKWQLDMYISFTMQVSSVREKWLWQSYNFVFLASSPPPLKKRKKETTDEGSWNS